MMQGWLAGCRPPVALEHQLLGGAAAAATFELNANDSRVSSSLHLVNSSWKALSICHLPNTVLPSSGPASSPAPLMIGTIGDV